MSDKAPHIPRPPSKDELDKVSEDQAMIADEWAPAPKPDGAGAGPTPAE